MSPSLAAQSGATLVAIPYTELSYAYYTRAKDPKWSPVLAAPPGNVNLPGGLFSPARHWLTLQSRSSFLIARLNDSSWRQVLQTVTARTGLEVEHPVPSSSERGPCSSFATKSRVFRRRTA